MIGLRGIRQEDMAGADLEGPDVLVQAKPIAGQPGALGFGDDGFEATGWFTPDHRRPSSGVPATRRAHWPIRPKHPAFWPSTTWDRLQDEVAPCLPAA